MDIQIGKTVQNKTLAYLTPIFKDYPTSFKQKLSQQVFKLAYGIHDELFTDSDIVPQDSRPIYILCDKLYGQFDDFLEWLRTQESLYITDYVASTENTSRKHMVVIKTIPEYHKTYDKFCVGLYSEMYSPKDIDRLYLNKNTPTFLDAYSVLTKEKGAEISFFKKINNTFAVKVNDSNFFDEPLKELDFSYKIEPENEIFNYNINKNE